MNHIKKLLDIINPMNWSLQKLLVVGGVVWLILTVLAIEPIVRATILKKFYQDVALAARYSNEMTFDNFVAKTQSTEATSSKGMRGGGYRFNNCSSAGIYQNNVTGRTIYGAFMCSRNFISYYGLDNFNIQAVADAKREMISLGWVDVQDEFGIDDTFSSIQNQTDGTVRGFSFKRGDRVNASMVFLTRGSEDYRSWCRNLRGGCQAFEKANTSHLDIMAVNISAYKSYED